LRIPLPASKAIRDPSGDQAAFSLTPFEWVSFRTPDPSAFIIPATLLRRLGASG
jgi:hypothetical protein